MSFITFFLCFSIFSVQAAPAQFTHQGRLLDTDGTPIVGEVIITFRVTDALTGGTTLWEERLTVLLTNGFYAAVLGSDEDGNPLELDVLNRAPIWLEMQLDGAPPMYPRQAIHSVPFARLASVAESVTGGVADVSELRVSGEIVIDEGGAWVGATPSVSWSELSGIPESLADDVDADSLAAISCASGEVLGWADEWVCSEDTDTRLGPDEVRGSVSGSPIDLAAGSTMDTQPLLTESLLAAELRDGDDDTLAMLDCTEGQVARFSELDMAWFCDDDVDTVLSGDDVRSIAETEPLSLASGTTIGGLDIATGAGVPSGVIVMWSGALADIPDGWQICDGSDGTPDLSERFVMGTASEPGEMGGSHEGVLSVDNLPSHSHSVNDPGHSHLSISPNMSGSGGPGRFETPYTDGWGTGMSTSTSTTGISIDSTGSGTPFDTRPAYFTLAFIIKT